MKYASYLGQVIKNQGFPKLNERAIQDYSNVIYLEGQLAAYKKMKSKLNNDELHKFELELFKLNNGITKITGNLPPREFLRLLINRERT